MRGNNSHYPAKRGPLKGDANSASPQQGIIAIAHAPPYSMFSNIILLSWLLRKGYKPATKLDWGQLPDSSI
jgi:hypothetical protein